MSSDMALSVKASFTAISIPLATPPLWFKPTEGKTKKTIHSVLYVPHMKMVFIVFPRMMSLVAEQRVMMAGLLRELAHRQKAMPSAQKREAQRHQQRGFSGFC